MTYCLKLGDNFMKLIPSDSVNVTLDGTVYRRYGVVIKSGYLNI